MSVLIDFARAVVRGAVWYTGAKPQSEWPAWMNAFYQGGVETDSGVTVSTDDALKYSPVWAAVNIISSNVGMLPMVVHKRLPEGGKERDTAHPAYRLLRYQPNEYMNAQVFRETLQAHVLTHGNGYALIVRDNGSRPRELLPILPNTVEPKIINEKLVYEVRRQHGETITLRPENVLHIHGLGFDGLKGYPVIDYHREPIGLGLAAQSCGAKLFGDGLLADGHIEQEAPLKRDKLDEFANEMKQAYAGLKNAHKLMILTGGKKYIKHTIEPDKAQFLESRKFSILDVSRMFQVPAHMLGELDRATFSNIEEQNRNFLQGTLGRWLSAWSMECRKLLTTDECKKDSHAIEFKTAALLKGDTQSRFAAYNIGINGGWMTANEVRAAENMNPIEGGDTVREPLNMKRADDFRAELTPERIAATFIPALDDVMGRMGRKAKNDIERHAKRDDFAEWEKEYTGTLQEVATEAFSPVLQSAAAAVCVLIDREEQAEHAAAEINKMMSTNVIGGEYTMLPAAGWLSMLVESCKRD